MDGGGPDAASVRRAWDDIVRHVGQASKKAAAFAREAVVRDIEGDTLILLFKHKIHADGVSGDPAPLLAAVSQVIGGSWRVRCEIGGEQRGGAASRPASAPPATSRGAGARSSASGRAAGGAAGRVSSAATTSASVTASKAVRAADSGSAPPAAEDWPTTAKIGGGHDDERPPSDDDVPYDPEFDGPPARAAHEPVHEGFDPGDEPDLDTDSLAVKQTSEEQALESLKQSFDLEKIAEKGS